MFASYSGLCPAMAVEDMEAAEKKFTRVSQQRPGFGRRGKPDCGLTTTFIYRGLKLEGYAATQTTPVLLVISSGWSREEGKSLNNDFA